MTSQQLDRRSAGYFEMKEGLLYPALHQLELDGLLKSEWQDGQGRRRRKYYSITPQGRKALAASRAEWSNFIAKLQMTLGASTQGF